MSFVRIYLTKTTSFNIIIKDIYNFRRTLNATLRFK